MKNPRTVAMQIAKLHNESIEQVKHAAEGSVEKAGTVGEKVVRLFENAVEGVSARTTEESKEWTHKLLEFAQVNADAYFEWLHELARVRLLSDFLPVCVKYSQQQFERFRQQSRELAALAQKDAIENMGPLGTLIGGALTGRPDLS